MQLRQFRLTVAGELTEAHAAALFDRAQDVCAEVLPAGGGVAWVAFDRPAPTLVDAVVSGVRDLDAAGLTAAAAVADDPIVTLETVAERIGRPVRVVRAWGLPEPIWAHPRRPVHDWPQVAEWLSRHRGYVPPDEGATLLAVTLALRLRALGPRLERMAPIRSLL